MAMVTEGFLCPECMTSLPSVTELVEHWTKNHEVNCDSVEINDSECAVDYVNKELAISLSRQVTKILNKKLNFILYFQIALPVYQQNSPADEIRFCLYISNT